MSKYKFSKCVTGIISDIYDESPMSKMYLAGCAYGMVYMYKSLEDLLDKGTKDIILKGFKEDSNINEYVNKMLEAYDSKNSKADDFHEAYEEYKQSKEITKE